MSVCAEVSEGNCVDCFTSHVGCRPSMLGKVCGGEFSRCEGPDIDIQDSPHVNECRLGSFLVIVVVVAAAAAVVVVVYCCCCCCCCRYCFLNCCYCCCSCYCCCCCYCCCSCYCCCCFCHCLLLLLLLLQPFLVIVLTAAAVVANTAISEMNLSTT